MKSLIQSFVAVQFAPFAFAAGAHFGVFTDKNDHGAGTAEAVIVLVLLAGLALTFTRATDVHPVALTVHSIMLITLLAGLATTMRAPRSVSTARPA